MKLSIRAFALENASAKGDTEFCVANLPAFLEGANNLNLKLKEAFSLIAQRGGSIEIPPELPPIFKRMIEAFAETDIVAIDGEIERLNALGMTGALRDEIEHIKDAVLIMDYDEAEKLMRELLALTLGE
jgi:hypothetical protein